ncbi:exodeoxyribonuclease VII large subunit [Natranaerovirga pectinivora]|uniref:Exodeoxyribonuclease 7 large subunit n=1 Tax=Natranaerovirga pectinivora TaxID=682400 RepID=A0A4R3MNX2_9FIRM|nr:exodeoxyribonuclease VII large subunit [Natranaerovirga pectinivora]TCT16921.1 exodeoxyribonuclease VII large subunit [Natranaerovirga pectinivora]
MRNIFSVAQVNAYVKNMFVQDYVLNDIWIKGEISNFKEHSSGHVYFTLKDNDSAIACVLFSRYRELLSCAIENGMNIIARGYVSVYERTGQYQVYVQQIQLDGIGLLYQRFEQLKKDLDEKGYFNAEYKKEIPRFPKRVGIVTSATGAAIQDIINIANRRNPYVQLILYPSLVQGQNASIDIVKGIKSLEENYEVDVIIIGRGGGSIEDLWAFNEEIVAQAIFECKVPIISAVGHETDFTIADFVSDLRAPTPSAAAELAIPSLDAIEELINQHKYRVNMALKRKLEHMQNIVKQLNLRMNYINPLYQIQENQQYLMDIENSMRATMEGKLKDNNHRIQLLNEKLKALSPYRTLKNGMAYITDIDGNIISSISQVAENQLLKVQISDGEITVNVKNKLEKRWE